MKLILLLSIVVICSFIGFSYGEEFLKRTNQLKELLRIVIELENEIVYSHTPLPECLKKIALKTKEPLKKLLEVVEEKLIKNEVLDVYDAFLRGINDEKENLSLKQEHYDIILDLSKSLGETSIDATVLLLSFKTRYKNITTKENVTTCITASIFSPKA